MLSALASLWFCALIALMDFKMLRVHGVKEMAQWIKCFCAKILSAHIKLSMLACICKPSAGAEGGRYRELASKLF